MSRSYLAILLVLGCAACGDDGGGGGGSGTGSVLQHHNNAARDGVYVDPLLTKAAVAGLHEDSTFSATIDGPTYAQPLYAEAAVGGKDVIVIATERNVVYALDAASGAVVWQTAPLATPVARTNLPCGNIDPLGITGTPYIDLGSRTIYLGAMTTPDGGATKKHEIFALSLDDGSVRSGWPVDVPAAVPGFQSDVQNQRGALVVEDGVLYVPYGGHYGDCGSYHGWLVGVNLSDPTKVTAWSTAAKGGGAWSAGGVSSDGTGLYLTTGNTFDATTWGGGDAVIRLAKGPVFSMAAADYFAPTNWLDLDNTDLDMGTHALVTAPGLSPSALVAGFGKDGKIYLLDRANLGGIGGQLARVAGATGEITGAVTSYTTSAGTFIAYRIEGGTGATCPNGTNGNMAAMMLVAGSPPTLMPAWCAKEHDQSLPITSMTDTAGTDAIVWNMGAHLYAYDAETGAELWTGGSLTNVRYFNTPIVAHGRVIVAGDDHVYAFTP